MAGFFSSLIGGPEQAQALGLLGAQVMKGRAADGFLLANQHLAEAPQRRLKTQLMHAQLQQALAEAQREQAALERTRRVQQAIPSLYRQPGMSGGEAVPQAMGGVPMFSQPMGAAPMRSTPGGFDVQEALRIGMTPKEIQEYAGLTDVGRPKATRQMEVDDGKGGKRIALVDDFGREVAGFSGYTAPVQVNRGDRIDFVKPAPGVSLGVNMSPEARASNALGWANNALTRRGQDLAEGRARDQQRYQMEKDRLDRTSGGGNVSEGERKAATLLQRLEGSQRQLSEALKTAPGAAKPEIFSSVIRALPGSPEAIANTVTSANRQRVEAAQLDMLDAALTLGTGAAYTREQLEGYRKSYFPQIGDDEATVLDKQERLNNVIRAARLAAGRAGNSVPSNDASGGWSIQRVN